MRRIQSACICQTLHFQIKEDLNHVLAVKQVKDEYENYKKMLEKGRSQYKIKEESTQPDGSIIVKVVRQYNDCPMGEYLES